MAHIADTDVAVVAEQPSDNAGIVAVIDVKPGRLPVFLCLAAGFLCLAYSATTVLLGKHPVVFAQRQPVMLTQMVVGRAAGVFLPPILLQFSGALHVVGAPIFYQNRVAGFAAARQSIPGFGAVTKLIEAFSLFAALAAAEAFRIGIARGATLVFLLFCNKARLTVRCEAVRLGSVFMKLVERFFFAAGFAGLQDRLLLRVENFSRLALP
jgi:hypothetical protein